MSQPANNVRRIFRALILIATISSVPAKPVIQNVRDQNLNGPEIMALRNVCNKKGYSVCSRFIDYGFSSNNNNNNFDDDDNDSSRIIIVNNKGFKHLNAVEGTDREEEDKLVKVLVHMYLAKQKQQMKMKLLQQQMLRKQLWQQKQQHQEEPWNPKDFLPSALQRPLNMFPGMHSAK